VNQVKNYTEDEVAKIAEAARGKLQIVDRKYRFKIFSACFVGTDLANWLYVNGVSKTKRRYLSFLFIHH